MLSSLWKIIVVVAVLVMASCGGGEAPSGGGDEGGENSLLSTASPQFAWEEDAPLTEVTEPIQPVSENISAPFDIGSVMKQVHFAFRPEGSFFTGGDTNYVVKVAKNGSFSVTPFHYPDGEKPLAHEEQLDPREEIERKEQQAREKPIEGTPATFKTASVSGINSVAQSLSTNDKANLEIHHGEVIEELKNTENGVEQSWRFAKKPDTTGDLTITVAVDSLDYIGATDNGLHFAEKGSELGLRYGVGTWIDANGARTTIVPQWQNGTITLTVPIAIIETSAYPAILDPVIGPEFGMDTPIWGPTTANGQINPAISFDGTNYLVVWQDYRSGTSYDIYGTRVTPEGVILDTDGIAISTAINDQDSPAIAFGGGYFLVVWEDFRKGKYFDIYGTRITREGTVLNPSGLVICNAGYSQVSPAVAVDGVDYLVVWEDHRNGDSNPDIYSAGVTTYSGEVHDAVTVISNQTSSQINPVVAYDGTNYLVIWEDYRSGTNTDIYGARISRGHFLLDQDGKVISIAAKYQRNPAIAFDGTNYLVVWEDSRNSTYGDRYDIYGTRVSKAAVALDTNGIAVNTATGNQLFPDVAFDGSNYLVVWDDYRTGANNDIYGTRVAKDGSLIGTEMVFSNDSDKECCPAIASSGNNRAMVVYHRFDAELSANRIKGRLFFNGAPGNICENNDQCDSGNCIDSVCCVAPTCDDDNVCTSDSCAVSGNGTCTHTAGNPGTECRSVAGICDIAETCSGDSIECPEDLFVAMGTECRAKDGDCDVADHCTGFSSDCIEEVALATVECRAKDGLCDVAEHCDGTTNTCPDDGVAKATVECRSRAGDCDVAENCNGTDKSCPTDMLAADTVQCRAQAGICDVTEHCTGNSIDCPADIKLTTECRPVAGVCDIAESCDGISNDCPPDTVKTASTVCRTAIDICDAAESCSGTSAFCPAEDYTTVNGDTCDDGNPLSLNDICTNGTCAGDIIPGTCGNEIVITPVPYTATGTTIGRPNALNAYGAACGNAGKPSPDIIYALTVEAGIEYLIEVAPEASYDVTINLLGACQNNEVCLGVANGGGEGEMEAIIYSSASPRTIYIALEGSVKNEIGSFDISVTTVEEPDDTPSTDADTTIEPETTSLPDTDTSVEPDDTAMDPDADTEELTDDTLVVIDEDTEIVDDTEVSDVDTVDISPVDDGVVGGDDDENIEDSEQKDNDTVNLDIDTQVETDTLFTDNEQPDLSNDEDPDKITDDILSDEDIVVPDSKITRPKDDGCGCTLVF